MSNDFSLSTQFEINEIEIDDLDVIGLFQSISIFENISSAVITGSIVMLDSDGASFVEKNKIEGNEKITFKFTNANKETLEFEGVLNGQRNKVVDTSKVMYTFDFSTVQVRKNEGKRVVNRFRNQKPREIVEKMVEHIGGTIDKFEGEGKPMSFIGARKRPIDVIKRVLTHGVTTKASSTEEGKNQEETAKGTTGFRCWQTLDGYRFNSVDEILAGNGGTNHGSFTYRLQNKGLPIKEAMDSVISYDFKVMGDMQTKLRSGAFKATVISFDIDKGHYKEYTYENTEGMTEKQKEQLKDIKSTRVINRPFSNEMFENSCSKASKGQHDQSREYLAQNTARQNTFNDQVGQFVLPPRFEFRAGDTFEAKIPKVESEKGGGYNEKHTGRYVISQVGHHLFNDGRAYTKVQTFRSTIQQDDTTSEES